MSNFSKIYKIIREIKRHFLEEGSPVMFGGDLYAYTLLGIELNEKTDEARYLILDPHF
jgi:hypothetical protein